MRFEKNYVCSTWVDRYQLNRFRGLFAELSILFRFLNVFCSAHPVLSLHFALIMMKNQVKTYNCSEKRAISLELLTTTSRCLNVWNIKIDNVWMFERLRLKMFKCLANQGIMSLWWRTFWRTSLDTSLDLTTMEIKQSNHHQHLQFGENPKYYNCPPWRVWKMLFNTLFHSTLTVSSYSRLFKVYVYLGWSMST